ncbi:MAG: hypothetical protein ABI615_01755 [Chthoniobacterales bacterium]
MSQHYGQDITYGVLGAPALFTGDNMNFGYDDQVTEDNLEGGGSDFAAMALHSRKGEISFEGEVTSASTDFLDLSSGAAITVAGSPGGIDLSTGFILAHEAVEEWNLLKRKTASVRASHYPDAADAGAGAAVVPTAASAFVPDQSSINFLFPGNTLIYSTVGITHASGLIHQLRLTQNWQITDDEPSPDGKLLGAFASGYKRMISLLLLAKPGDAVLPAPRSILTFTGAPARMKNFRVIKSSPKLERKKGMMFQIDAAWIPPFGTA